MVDLGGCSVFPGWSHYFTVHIVYTLGSGISNQRMASHCQLQLSTNSGCAGVTFHSCLRSWLIRKLKSFIEHLVLKLGFELLCQLQHSSIYNCASILRLHR